MSTQPTRTQAPCPQITPVDGTKLLHAGLNLLASQDGQLCYVYVSRTALTSPAQACLLATIHGYNGSRPGEGHAVIQQQCLTPWEQTAEEHGWIIVAPHFDASLFNDDYQRLNPFGLRADVRLNQICDTLPALVPGLCAAPMRLFGFSGGGQFVHRYVAFHPERVQRAVAAAAGWYMWPDPCLPYPLGTGTWEASESLIPQVQALCALDLLILVGEEDVDQNIFLEQAYRGHDLTRLQGENRLARARHWVAAVHGLATTQGWPYRLVFTTIPQTGHVLGSDLLTVAEVFLEPA